MNGPISKPSAFERAALIGQPFTLKALYLPVNAVVTCNCGGEDTTIKILLSAPASCPSCGRHIAVTFNPTTGQLEVALLAEADKEPS